VGHESISRERLLSRFAIVPALFSGHDLMRGRKRLGWVAYCLLGVFLSVLHPLTAFPQCAATTVLSQSFDLNQVISFTGTDVTTGSQGAFVPVNGSPSTFTLPCSQDLEFRFDFRFDYLSGPSTMMLDLRFVLDGVPTAATRFPLAAASPQLRLILDAVLAGSHTLTVEVRSVRVGGPPEDVTLCGNSGDCYVGGPGATAKLEVENFGTTVPVLSQSFNLNQVINFTGTDVTTGSQGAFVPVNGSSSTFTSPCSEDLEFRFDFWFTYSHGPSVMMLDLRFVLDGVPTAATRFPTSATPQLTLISHSVPAGSHTLTVEVRSVLAEGPPEDVTLCGNSDCYNGGPGTAKLEVEGFGTTVPNVVSLTQAAATTAITGAKLAVGTVTQQPSTTVPTGNVISQGPASGNFVVQCSTVNLVISQGAGLHGISFQLTTTSLTTTSNGTVTFQGTVTNNSGADLNATDLFFNFCGFNNDSVTPSQDLGNVNEFLIPNGSTTAVVNLFEVRLGSVPAGSSFQIQVQLEDANSELSTAQAVLVSTPQ
jgi:PASTA domain